MIFFSMVDFMAKVSQKFFNIAGPCFPTEHYMLPAVERLPNLNDLFLTKSYFVLHAPRQSGKTTAIMAMVDEINRGDDYYALYLDLESLERISDLPTGLSNIITKIFMSLNDSGIRELSESFIGIAEFDSKNPDGLGPDGIVHGILPTLGNAVALTLRAICKKLDRDLLIFFDEIDTLSGDILVTFLRQLREGYNLRRATPFPRSIALIGMRNIRDYWDRIRPDSESLGSSSPFNIITEAFSLHNFTSAEVKTLYAQHTAATGQIFEPEAVDRVMFWTDGQPWLVNALANNIIRKQLLWDFSQPITPDHIDQAAETLKLEMNVHIDSLMARLHEPRIKRVLTAILTGSDLDIDLPSEDLRYCLELGLIKETSRDTFSPANRIYADVMVRLLTANFQRNLPNDLVGRFVKTNGPDINELLKDFQLFWSENSDKMSNRFAYKECDAEFFLFGYMQKAFNGTVQIIKEFASGTGFVDLCANYKRQRFPIELKMKWDGYSKPASLAQLRQYMDRCQAREGWLVVFDRDSRKLWSDKIFWQTETCPGDIIIHIVGC
jgi:hypothetical protein